MRMSEREYEALIAKSPKTAKDEAKSVNVDVPKRGKPNKTELEFSRMLSFRYPGCIPRFEAVTVTLDNGHRYTPDWCLRLPTGELLCVEVKARGKNGFRHPSYGRARLAFDQALIDFPMFKWAWAEKHAGIWTVTDY